MILMIKIESIFMQYFIPHLLCYKNIAIADLDVEIFVSPILSVFQLKNFNINQFYCVELNPITQLRDYHDYFVISHHDLNQAKLEIPNNSVDFVYTLEVIEHLINVDILEEVKRILRPHGLITTPNLAA